MRRWVLGKLGALAWLDDLTEFGRRVLEAEDRRDRWRARAEEAEARVALTEQDTAAAIRLLVEPPPTLKCIKIRCYSQDIADKLARSVERQSRWEPNAMHAYKCDRCPLQPVTGERWWHIAMTDPSMRGNGKFEHWNRPLHQHPIQSEQGDALRARLFGEAG
jgi:hypothetical protein